MKKSVGCKEYVQSIYFVWIIKIMFGNSSSVRKGGHSFVRRIDILSGNRSSIRMEDR